MDQEQGAIAEFEQHYDGVAAVLDRPDVTTAIVARADDSGEWRLAYGSHSCTELSSMPLSYAHDPKGVLTAFAILQRRPYTPIVSRESLERDVAVLVGTFSE